VQAVEIHVEFLYESGIQAGYGHAAVPRENSLLQASA